MKEKLTHFRIGQIVNTQGLKGEVRVYPYVDDINRFDELENFYLDKNFNQEFEVERVRYKGNMVIMKIKGVDSVEMAERLKTKNLYVSRENSVDLDEDEFFIADLIGLDVFTVAGDILIDTTAKYFAQYAFHACRQTKFALATLGNDAGMYGGACSILNQ